MDISSYKLLLCSHAEGSFRHTVFPLISAGPKIGAAL